MFSLLSTHQYSEPTSNSKSQTADQVEASSVLRRGHKRFTESQRVGTLLQNIRVVERVVGTELKIS